MTFSTLAPLKPISKCGQGCVSILVLVQIIFCIIACTAEFWKLGFTDCASVSGGEDDIYIYMLLNEGICVDSKSDKTSGFSDCTDWTDVDTADDTANDDAEKYSHAYGLFVSAVVFASCLLLLTGVSYYFVHSEYSEKLRYTQIVFGVLVTALSAGAVGSVSETYYTDEENYPYNSFCNDSYTVPGSGWVFGFFCVWVAAATVGALLYPCLKCVYNEADVRRAETPPDDTYNAVVHGP